MTSSIISIVLAPLLVRIIFGVETDKPSKFTTMWEGDVTSHDTAETETELNNNNF